jgi:hypothetical protein
MENLRSTRAKLQVTISARHEAGHAAPFEAYALARELCRRGYAVGVQVNGGDAYEAKRRRAELRVVR